MVEYKVYITERSECTSCEVCVATAPDNFFMDADGWATNKKERITEREAKENIECMDSCPAQIIKVEEIV